MYVTPIGNLLCVALTYKVVFIFKHVDNVIWNICMTLTKSIQNTETDWQ